MANNKKPDREYPLAVEDVAQAEKCEQRTVQKWAVADGEVRKLGSGKRAPFMFYSEDVQRFRERERPGRPRPKEK
jgi:hypothetical protein